MQFFNQYAIPPSEGYLELLRYLLVMVLMVHVPYAGLVLGSATISVLLNHRDRDAANPHFARLAKDLMDVVVPNHSIPFAMGVLPLFALWLIYGQWLYGATTPSLIMFPIGAVLIALCFGLLIAYRATLFPQGQNTFINLNVGLLGLGMLVLGTMVEFTAVVRLHDPERWHLGQSWFRFMLSFNVIWKHAIFVLAGFAFTGVGMLFFILRRSERAAQDEDYARFVKNFGAGIAIACLLPIPVAGLFYMVTTPIIAMSGAVFAIAAVIALLLFVVFVFLYQTILDRTPRFGTPLLFLFVVVFLLMAIGDQFTLVNATQEHTAMLVAKAEAREVQLAMEREAALAEQAADPADGKRVFEEVCLTCHRMDEKLVGPPLNEVLPKYGSVGDLVAYLKAPPKVDPNYPPMPAPPITLTEMKSVATYLLGGGEAESAPQGETEELH